MRKIIFRTAIVTTVALFLSGCSSSGMEASDPLVIKSPEKISIVESSLEFECTDKNEYFYEVYFGVSIKNETGQKITNENLNSIGLEAGLLNINDMGREETTDFAVSASGIEPGESGLLAFSLRPSLGIEWKSLDISVKGKKSLDKPIVVSERLCF